MFNTESLKHIKKGIFLINTCRAQVIEEKAVLLGLKKKLILGVGLDILAPEKLENYYVVPKVVE